MPDATTRRIYHPGDQAIVRNDGALQFNVGGRARCLLLGDLVAIVRRGPDHDDPEYGLGYWFTHPEFVDPRTGEPIEFVLNDGMIGLAPVAVVGCPSGEGVDHDR